MIRVYLPTIQGNDVWALYDSINEQERQLKELGYQAIFCPGSGALFVEFMDETQAALFKLTNL